MTNHEVIVVVKQVVGGTKKQAAPVKGSGIAVADCDQQPTNNQNLISKK